MLGQLAGGWVLVRQALAAQRHIDAGTSDTELAAKLTTAAFYCEQLLPLAAAQQGAVFGSVDAVMSLDSALF